MNTNCSTCWITLAVVGVIAVILFFVAIYFWWSGPTTIMATPTSSPVTQVTSSYRAVGPPLITTAPQ